MALAAEGHGVEPAQIAKTLALRVADEVILIVTRGDARLDNKKYKAKFATKARMLGFDEVEAETGHPVGGVCPFGLAKPHKVYCDISLKDSKKLCPRPGRRMRPSGSIRTGWRNLLLQSGSTFPPFRQTAFE